MRIFFLSWAIILFLRNVLRFLPIVLFPLLMTIPHNVSHDHENYTEVMENYMEYVLWKQQFTILLKPSLKDFEHNLTSMSNEYNWTGVWKFFGNILFLELECKLTLSSPCGHCWVFQIFSHIKCSTLRALSFRILNRSAGIPSPLLALFIVMLPKAHRLHTSGCLALAEWAHHHGYPVH